MYSNNRYSIYLEFEKINSFTQQKLTKMKKIFYTLSLSLVFGCAINIGTKRETLSNEKTNRNESLSIKTSNVVLNSNSEEILFVIEMSIKDKTKNEVEKFTQYLSDFIVEREPSTVYGYFISDDGSKVSLIERYNNSKDGIQHGKDFVNGPNINKFFEFFEIDSFLVLGKATDEFKIWTKENGFKIEYRESVAGYLRK